jgi:hypothetical protein
MSKVRILTGIAGERFSYGPRVYEVPTEIPEARAREFIAAGWAEEVQAADAPASGSQPQPTPVPPRRR